MTALLTLTGVSVRFGARTALAGVDLEVGPGELIAIVGPNGAGKTTLFRTILGAVAPASGRVERSVRPGYVPQRDEEDLTYPLTALDVTLIGAYRRRPWWRPLRRALRGEALAELERVGLGDRAGSPIGELSGGQRQRVLLARALLTRSPLLLLDEPLSGVDVTTRDVVARVLEERRALGDAILLTTHDLALARSLATRVVCINGRVVADGPPAAALAAETLRETFADAVLIPGGAS